MITSDPSPDPRRTNSTQSLFTVSTVVRSLVLSLMDTADRFAEWLARRS